MVLGLVFALGGLGLKVSEMATLNPQLTKLITRFVSGSVPEQDFPFSSLQVLLSLLLRVTRMNGQLHNEDLTP